MSTDPNQLQALQQALLQSQQGPNFPVRPGQEIDPQSFNVRGPNLMDRLQQIAGFIGVGGGTAANIIAAKNRTSPTGNSSISMGLDQLRNASKDIEDKEAQVKVSKFLPLVTDKNDKLLANQYLQTGDYKGALKVINDSFNSVKDLRDRMKFAGFNTDLQLGKQLTFQELEQARKDAREADRYGRYYDLTTKSLIGAPMTPDEIKEQGNLSNFYEKSGLGLNPNTNPRLNRDIQKISEGLGGLETLDKVVNNFERVTKELDGGRFAGKVIDLKNLVASSPELQESRFDAQALKNFILRSIMGEKGNLSEKEQEPFLRLLKGENLSKDELNVIVGSMRRVSNDRKEALISSYGALRGATPESLKQLLENRNRMKDAYKEISQPQSTAPDYDKLGIGETTFVNGVKVKRIK